MWIAEMRAGSLIHMKGSKLQRVRVGGNPRDLITDGLGRVWYSDVSDGSIKRYDPVDGRIRVICSQVYNQPLQRPAGLTFDADGHLLFACESKTPRAADGYVCCVACNSDHVEMIANELAGPTTVLMAHQMTQLYIIETGKNRIWRGDWNSSEQIWIDEAVWSSPVECQPGTGSTALGVDGLLYVSSGDRVVGINPLGLLVDRMRFAGSILRGVAFDPSGERGMVLADDHLGRLWQLPWMGTGFQIPDSGSKWL